MDPLARVVDLDLERTVDVVVAGRDGRYAVEDARVRVFLGALEVELEDEVLVFLPGVPEKTHPALGLQDAHLGIALDIDSMLGIPFYREGRSDFMPHGRENHAA